MFDGIAKFEVQVKPEDLDELNHVNNVVYMRWMEMAALWPDGLRNATSRKDLVRGWYASTGSNTCVTANWMTLSRSIPGCRSSLQAPVCDVTR